MFFEREFELLKSSYVGKQRTRQPVNENLNLYGKFRNELLTSFFLIFLSR